MTNSRLLVWKFEIRFVVIDKVFPSRSDIVNEKVLLECLNWMECLLDKPAGRQALEKFFDGASSQHSLVQVLLSVASPRTSSSTTYGAKVFSFFNKMFQYGK